MFPNIISNSIFEEPFLCSLAFQYLFLRINNSARYRNYSTFWNPKYLLEESVIYCFSSFPEETFEWLQRTLHTDEWWYLYVQINFGISVYAKAIHAPIGNVVWIYFYSAVSLWVFVLFASSAICDSTNYLFEPAEDEYANRFFFHRIQRKNYSQSSVI